MTDSSYPRTSRWTEQQWAIDNIIQANGVDWDQPRSTYWNAPCGLEASADFAMVRARVKKYADIAPAFEAQAQRRELEAQDALGGKRLVAARESFFIAAIHWGAAQWPIDRNNTANRRYNERKRACFQQYAQLADHRVDDVVIPFGGSVLRAWLHLPVNYQSGQLPVVVSFPGMDSFKEASVSMYGDPLLSRGMAVLSVDGPGQYEALFDNVFLTVEHWQAAGRACVDYLRSRPEIDETRIAVMGRSFGSFGATIAAAAEPRFCATAVSATCFARAFEPLCQSASPSFKMRLMFMSNFADEAAFDDFRQNFYWEGRLDSLTAPYLCIAGASDELSPIEDAERLVRSLSGLRRLVVYEGSRHSVGFGTPSAQLGPNVNTLAADWLEAVFVDRPPASERWFVDNRGHVTKSNL
jgi:dienelactone hydrolase